MASLDGWTVTKEGYFKRNNYEIRPFYNVNTNSYLPYKYFCRLTNGNIKQYRSLHGAISSMNKIIDALENV